MKTEIIISGANVPQEETDNEKQRLGNCGDYIDIDCAYRLGIHIQTGFGTLHIGYDSMRKRRDDLT